MANKPVPKGRGALLEMLKKHTEATVGSGAGEEEQLPPKSRGRAALIQKIQEQKGRKVGIEPESPKQPPVQPGSSTSSRRPPVEKITKAVSELSLASSDPVYYRGESGERIRAAANHVELLIEQDRGVFEYEVRFNPDIDARSNRIKLVNQALGELATTKVYDGDSCLYLPAQVYSDKREFSGVIPNTTDSVTTIIIYKRKKKLSECLHLYNVLFKRIMNILLYTRMGKNYFSPDHKHLIPQHKLEVFPGYAVAVDELEGGLRICLDTQHRVIRSQTVYELLHEIKASNPRNFRETATKMIIGACVLTKYNNKTYIVDDIGWDISPKDTFDTKGGGTCRYVDYYKQHYSLSVNDIDQPMLINRQSRTINNEKVEHMVCLVPELTYLTGLTDAMRADFRVMKDVAAYTRITPNQRMHALRTYIDKVRNSEMAQQVLAGWGLKIGNASAEVPARVLPKEPVYFGGQRDYVGSGDWNKAVGDNFLTGPIDILSWQLFYTPRDSRYAQNFSQTITRLAKGMGCTIREPQFIQLQDDRTETYMAAIRDNITRNVQVGVFICPTMRTDRYSVIKKLLCTQIPVASQVILSKTLSNQQKVRTIIHKIGMQIICKLGGTLWNVKIPATGWMICGIDVYHGTNQQSVCGFVSSLNDSLTKYFSEAHFQDREIGDFLKMSFRKALIERNTRMGSFPKMVIIFRDGVGDGQLSHCSQYEVTQFQEVLRELNLETELVFVVVQKRINTRIFHLKDNTNTENPPSGTVVDSIITRRNLHDFFLVPQSVRQGTVNPTHYIVLHGANAIKADHLQRLAYKLCHLYYNWSGTIRVPAPCLYAHKLASMVGQYIKKTPDAELSDKLFYL